MSNTPTVRPSGPTTRSQTKVSGSGSTRLSPTIPKLTRTKGPSNNMQKKQISCGPRVTPKATLGATPVNVQGQRSTSPGTTVPTTPITTRIVQHPAMLTPREPCPHTTLRDAWSNERAMRNRILQSEGGTQEYIVPDSVQDRPRPSKRVPKWVGSQTPYFS
jgi:hypothetical protein